MSWLCWLGLRCMAGGRGLGDEEAWSEGSSATTSYRAPVAVFAQTVSCLRSDLHALYFSTPERAPSFTIDERERIVNPARMKLPLRLYQYEESFGIQDAEGYSVCYLYFDDDPKRRIVTKRMTKAEAESVAKQIARALTDNAEKGRG